jgi:hypothetical protein
MVMLSVYMNEGGHRQYLWVSEGNRIAHLLYIPTLEYVKIPVTEVQRQKAIGRATERPVQPDLAKIIHAKAHQWDDLEKRFSRILVNEALGKLGAAPLPAKVYADDNIPRADGEAAPKARKPREGKSKAEMVGDLLLRPEGCTTADILAATGWPAVSVPAQAKLVGLTLRKEKVPGQATRYWGAK